MDLTPYHAKYFAYELTKRFPSDKAEKLAGQKQIKAWNGSKMGAGGALYNAQDEIDRRRYQVIGEIEGNLQRI